MWEIIQSPVLYIMYRTNPIWIYWTKTLKAVKTSLQLLKKEISKNEVHELRTGIKKLRACTELHIRVQGGKKKSALSASDSMENFSVIFDTCGRQRDIEICLEILPELEMQTGKKLPGFRAFLGTVLKSSYSWSRSCIRNFRTSPLNSLTNIIRDEIRKTDVVNPPEKIGRIIKKEMEWVHRSVHKPHLLRKKLKNLYYWMTILDEKDSRQQQLMAILDDLGRWQDYEILLKRMKHFRKDFLPAPLPEHSDIRETEKNIVLKKKKLLHSVNKTSAFI